MPLAPHLCGRPIFIRGFCWSNKSALAFIDHRGVEKSKGGSFANLPEVEMIARILARIIKYADVRPDEVAVITPYNLQKEALQTKLVHFIKKGMMVETVDKAQGCERPLVIYSTVRTNSNADK